MDLTAFDQAAIVAGRKREARFSQGEEPGQDTISSGVLRKAASLAHVVEAANTSGGTVPPATSHLQPQVATSTWNIIV